MLIIISARMSICLGFKSSSFVILEGAVPKPYRNKKISRDADFDDL
jgi:hypothetical protein